MKEDLKSMSLSQMEQAFSALGEPKFRAKQVFTWLHRGAVSFDAMTNLSKPLREKLDGLYYITAPSVARKQVSKLDGTIKYLWKLRDGNCVESVVMQYHHGNTVCISSEVGCPMGCKFCASGLLGLKRNLTTGEIIGQILSAEAIAGKRVNNLVFMGMGEPLSNFDNLEDALEIITSHRGLEIGARHITISTSGFVPGLKKLAAYPRQIRLAVSLHGATDEVRDQIMPVNKKWPLSQLIPALEEWGKDRNQMPTLEYILIRDVNDSLNDASHLVRIAKRLHAKVNLIPYNTVEGLPWQRAAAPSGTPSTRRASPLPCGMKKAMTSTPPAAS